MDFRETDIPGCVEITPRILRDERGTFVKTFHREMFAMQGLNTAWAEEYYSVSHRGVLRGLHFQLPPHDHDKLVYCTRGSVLDAALDLRRGSPTYGGHVLLELSATAGNMLYLPRGLAHGFYVQSESATLVYKVTSVYAPQHDAGILWNSAGIPWPDNAPTLSPRDAGFGSFNGFASPFEYQDRRGAA
ncbi:dTDP-4-dehydrorhamnose 3,5-epimerase [Geobacter anodireducens]|uniref:dTDP-4-dehydrorhamnose 3,5-epimerase n=1 Tax=Geobacter soli TaxID=1510391 RepID=A0A0C1QYU1_9BACT|nr:dTDP-4-dehydrorhamnose 3,5-epimerase [Geobacter soli]KIE43356.1 dTDP-4-dehydrorhamnose 3,5-epimerase [Geobacter soli]